MRPIFNQNQCGCKNFFSPLPHAFSFVRQEIKIKLCFSILSKSLVSHHSRLPSMCVPNRRSHTRGLQYPFVNIPMYLILRLLHKTFHSHSSPSYSLTLSIALIRCIIRLRSSQTIYIIRIKKAYMCTDLISTIQ